MLFCEVSLNYPGFNTNILANSIYSIMEYRFPHPCVAEWEKSARIIVFPYDDVNICFPETLADTC